MERQSDRSLWSRGGDSGDVDRNGGERFGRVSYNRQCEGEPIPPKSIRRHVKTTSC